MSRFGLWAWVWLALGLSVATAQLKTLPEPERIAAQQGLPQAFVASILQDKQGFMWMATRDGLCRYDGNTFKVFQPSPGRKPSLSSPEVMQMALDRQGKIWLVSATGDLDLFDPAHETFVNVSRQPFYQKTIGSQPIKSIYVDSQNGLWICVWQQGLAYLDLAQKTIRRYRHQADKPGLLPSDIVQAVVEDPADANVLWVSSYGGLDRLNRRTGQLIHASVQADRSVALPSEMKELYALPNGQLLIRFNGYLSVVDQRIGMVRQFIPLPVPELIWHWTPSLIDRKHGVIVSQYNRLFRLDQQKGLQEIARLPDGLNIQCLFIDQSDVLWVGTNGRGVFKFNLKAQTFTAIPYQQSFHADVLNGQLHLSGLPNFDKNSGWAYRLRSTTDSLGRVWCNVRNLPFIRFDPVSRQATAQSFAIGTFFKDPEDYPIPMATDPQGRVWGLYDSLAAWYDEPQNRWVRFPHRFHYQPGGHPAGGIPTETVILDFVVDEQALWMISRATGLYRVDRRTGTVRQYTSQPNDPSSISSNKLLCLFADPADKAVLWIGTFGSGLCRFDKRTGKCRRLTTADGLPNNVIYAAIPDRQGNLWVATNQGLGRMDRRTFRTRIYTREDGLAGDEFNRYHYLHLPDDRIFLGGLEGITIFDPADLRQDTYQPPVQLIGIQLNGKPLQAQSGPVHILSGLTLTHDQNFVTVQFAAMQYNRRNKLRYRYQLEGLETQWTETDRPVAVYTGLQPGRYVLRLNAANTDGIWSSHIRTLRLTIEPPFWATWWAYILYVLAFGGIVFGLIGAYVNRIKLQQSVEIKQKEVELKQLEAEQLRATNDMRNRFFANITHEFRTPLTLILAPTDQMLSENPEPRVRRRMATIEQNAHQLLRLINQLLDLSRLEGGVMPIHEARGDLTDCIAHWLQPLIEQANAQRLALTFHSEVTGSYYFDAEKLERIVYNLTANALKFTQAGAITVSLSDSPQGIQLTVSDTGIGIPAQELGHIFDRFYQVNGANETLVAQQSGTGIGLALVRELIQLQQGSITVDSTVGKGTTFIVSLPYRRAKSTGQRVANSPERPPAKTSDRDLSDRPSSRLNGEILIVEDNDELAYFIAESLSATYRIRRAVNGRDGLEQAREHLPDLVISDVMMPVQSGPIQAGDTEYQPEVDGFALCGYLKSDLRTSHIPVILLTAKVTQEDRMEGLSQGADDYLTKPFYVEELRLRVHNQLEQRRRQREWLRQQLTSADQPLPDDPFLTRFYELIEANLANTQLSVESLADQLALSRSHLHRKVKTLTGFSANELVRNYRLKAATQLLRNGFNSAETADRVGFESAQYFAKCFRELYGLTPTEFARNHPKKLA